MSTRARIFLGLAVIVAAGFYYLVTWIRDDLRPRYLESVEESLVDTANILSCIVAGDSVPGHIEVSGLKLALAGAGSRRLSARIYDLEKTCVDLRVYVTDTRGTVVFDSAGLDEGEWNDVIRTLRGEYGARATREVPDDPSTLVLYVSAPVRVEGELVGVLTACKPTGTIHLFIEGAKRKIAIAGTVAALAVVALGLFVSVWVTGPIRKLTGYARSVSEGRRAALPELGGSEIGDLGRAFDQMREALEGKKYVERYVEALTHEVKGPLSGIRGAAELLAEGVPADARGRFTANILKETGRIERIVDRLLLLSALESRHGLRDVEAVDLAEVAADLADALAPVLESRDLSLRNEVEGPAEIRGERFLVRQAVANLLQNAVEFSPAGREIALRLERGEGWAEIVVEDSGPGVPDYARERVFERFYSLQRPDTGAKSSGLGLSFVREAALLHGGSARLEDRPGGGTRAVLRLATGPPQS